MPATEQSSVLIFSNHPDLVLLKSVGSVPHTFLDEFIVGVPPALSAAYSDFPMKIRSFFPSSEPFLMLKMDCTYPLAAGAGSLTIYSKIILPVFAMGADLLPTALA